MNFPQIKWWTLSIPGVVFVVVLVGILLTLPKPEVTTTDVAATAQPSVIDLGNTVNVTQSDMEKLNSEIVNFKIDDPLLASPNFDRQIALPKE